MKGSFWRRTLFLYSDRNNGLQKQGIPLLEQPKDELFPPAPYDVLG
jgi:hypothetical protein